MVTGPTTVTADGESQNNDIKVTFDARGGTIEGDNYMVVSPGAVTYGAFGQFPQPEKAGNSFDGWYDKDPAKSSDAKKVYTTSTSIDQAKDHTLYADWNSNPYTVYFNGNGGTVNKSSMQVVYGNSFGTLATASKSGYGFLGWYTSSGVKVTSSSLYNIAGNTTLTAKWGRNYKITFLPNGGTVNPKSKYVTNGVAYGSMPVPKRKGYTFVGWYTKTKGGARVLNTRTVALTRNTTFYAKWTLSKYRLYFNPYGGRVSTSSKTITYSKKYGALPKPRRTGYTFLGWYTKKKGGVKLTKSTKLIRTANRTLYAKWRVKKVKIKFHPNRGKVNQKSKTIKYNRKYGTLPKPKRKGYKFKGWYTGKNNGSKITSASKMKYTKNKYLFARWAKAYRLNFDYRGGKKGKSYKNVYYNEKYGTLPATKRAGYKFKGWFTRASGGTQVTSGLVFKNKKSIRIYAQWESTISLPITKMYAPEGSKARPGYNLNFGGVTIHNTGNTSSTADAFNHAKYLQGSGKNRSASWHYCVDEADITQSIPENEMAWHAGDGRYGRGNSRNIAIEICMNKGGDLLAATDRAAKLTANILARKGHTEAVSGVNVFQHNHHSGKNCPEMLRSGKPYSWSTFIKKVNSYL